MALARSPTTLVSRELYFSEVNRMGTKCIKWHVLNFLGLVSGYVRLFLFAKCPYIWPLTQSKAKIAIASASWLGSVNGTLSVFFDIR